MNHWALHAAQVGSAARWLDPEWCVRVTLALVHFLWQGMAVAGLIMLAWPLLRRVTPTVRYHTLLAALLVMAACPVATFVMIETPAPLAPAAAPDHAPAAPLAAVPAASYAPSYAPYRAPEPDTPTGADVGGTRPAPNGPEKSPPPPPPTGVLCATTVRPYAPGAVAVYLVGVAALIGRLLLALQGGQRLRRASEPVTEPELLAAAARQARRLGLTVAPPVVWCGRVAVPTVVGLLRPVVLLPVALATGMSAAQVEIVLAHELAHVRRYDHVVNVLQRLIEALLFFHPAVWFISSRIRAERERCCDDLALAGEGPDDADAARLAYAELLVRAAEMASRPGHPAAAAALAATGSGRPSELRLRVLRLLDRRFREPLRLGRGAAAALALAAAVAVAGPLLLRARAAGEAAGERPPLTTAPAPGQADSKLLALNALEALGPLMDDVLADPRGGPARGGVPTVRREILSGLTLELVAKPEVADALAKLSASQRNVTWFEGVEALEKSKSAWGLALALHHHHDDVKIRSAQALARLKDGRAVPSLLAVAESMDVIVGGSENAALHGILQHEVAGALNATLGTDVKLKDGQDPQGVQAGVEVWRAAYEKLLANGAAPRAGRPGVLLVTDGNVFLEKAVQGEAEAARAKVETATPDDYAKGKAPADGRVVIFDRIAPQAEPDGAAGVMYVGALPPGFIGGRLDGEGRPVVVEGVTPTEWNADHPALKGVAGEKHLAKVYVASALKVTVPAGYEQIVGGDKGPLVLAGEAGGRRRLVLTFDLLQSNWPLRPSFPVFLGHSLRWLGGAAAVGAPAAPADDADARADVEMLERLRAELKAKPELVKDPEFAWRLDLLAMQGHRRSVAFLIEKGLDPNVRREPDGLVPLHFAAYAHSADAAAAGVELLLKAGADPNAASVGGVTPLHVAVGMVHLPVYAAGPQEPSTAVVRLLLDGGANVNGRDRAGRTALHGAAALDKGGDILAVLLAAKASVDAPDARGRTPLHYAAEAGVTANVRALLAAGAKVHQTDDAAWTALQLAAFNGHRETAAALVPEASGYDIFSAAALGMKERVAEVMAGGFPANRRHGGGWMPLHWAVHTNRPDVARVLLDAGADPNARGTADGMTVLRLAAMRKFPVGMLLEKAADAKAAGADGVTALHAAAEARDLAAVEALVKAGADVNARDERGETALSIVVKQAGSEAQAGAFLGLMDALAAGKLSGRVLNDALLATRDVPPALMARLLDLGADVNTGSGETWTPLHFAANDASERLVELLLKRGADPNAKDHNGDPPLYQAITAVHASPKVIRLLLDHGADVNAKVGGGDRTPLGVARESNKPEVEAVLKEFEAKGGVGKR